VTVSMLVSSSLGIRIGELFGSFIKYRPSVSSFEESCSLTMTLTRPSPTHF
jgi:hypothetical protein